MVRFRINRGSIFYIYKQKRNAVQYIIEEAHEKSWKIFAIHVEDDTISLVLV